VAGGGRHVIDRTGLVVEQHAEYGILLARTDAQQRGRRASVLPARHGRPASSAAHRQMTGDGVLRCSRRRRCPPRRGSAENQCGWPQVLLDERGRAAPGSWPERRLTTANSLAGDDPVRRGALLRLCRRPGAARSFGGGAGGAATTSSAKLMRTELSSHRGAPRPLRGPAALLAGPATDRFLYAPDAHRGGTNIIASVPPAREPR
jgi:hypothetical protein